MSRSLSGTSQTLTPSVSQCGSIAGHDPEYCRARPRRVRRLSGSLSGTRNAVRATHSFYFELRRCAEKEHGVRAAYPLRSPLRYICVLRPPPIVPLTAEVAQASSRQPPAASLKPQASSRLAGAKDPSDGGSDHSTRSRVKAWVAAQPHKLVLLMQVAAHARMAAAWKTNRRAGPRDISSIREGWE